MIKLGMCAILIYKLDMSELDQTSILRAQKMRDETARTMRAVYCGVNDDSRHMHYWSKGEIDMGGRIQLVAKTYTVTIALRNMFGLLLDYLGAPPMQPNPTPPRTHVTNTCTDIANCGCVMSRRRGDTARCYFTLFGVKNDKYCDTAIF